MKLKFRIFLQSILVLLLTSLLIGCGGGDDERQYDEDLDIDAQVQALTSGDDNAKADAAAALGLAGPRAAPAVDALIAGLKSPNEEVRTLSSYALMEIGTAAKKAAPQLRDALKKARSMGESSQHFYAIKAVDPEGSKDLNRTVPNVPPGSAPPPRQ
jgi:HEAT repeat protein